MKHAYNFQDHTGKKMHRLTFLEFVELSESRNARWKVRCDCGTEFIVTAECVKRGTTRSCGCLRAEMLRARNKRLIKRNTKCQ